ncbi:hypothetical protein PFICI_12164 [Pestalotiopsis fici W106-1]|uniref:Heterokaryon incompatibility domain-containing protein n=1 Tax=Pestalotiopsis fici (strain W106-1 / CGMCC3.15140) TaxID=1229662 RepID=W3WUI8_PESFW|nr:uncharacterized protein PFICI_12164 [Pestalotiopsis fici W106-1]ETS76777.1 hypothetical protein PFICI_12164 [Pestalotiopsis fici W106-1]
MAANAFEYDQLDRSAQSIRLLRILPYADTLDCVLETFDIRECPKYQALSYVWGSDDASCEIRINQSIVLIRNNLWDALQELKTLRGRSDFHYECEDHIWIDAICINQNDDVERSHQVNLMSLIFSQAARTIAWLGREDNNSTLAMKTLAKRQCPKSLAPTVCLEEIWTAIDAVFSRVYFERMWIVQEVLLSNKLLLLCGSSFCSWHDIIWFHDHWQDWFEQNVMCDLPLTLITTKEFLDRHRRLRPVRKLKYLLLNLRRRQCLDQRDKIYALLGIIFKQSSDSNPQLEADYTISSTELYSRMVTFFKVLPEGDRNVIYAELLNILDMPKSTRHSIRLARDIDRIIYKIENHPVGGIVKRLDVIGSVKDRAFLYMILDEIETRFGVSLTSFPAALELRNFSTMSISGDIARDVFTLLMLCHPRVMLLLHLWQQCMTVDNHLQRLILLPTSHDHHAPKWKNYAFAASEDGLLDISVFMEKTKGVRTIIIEFETGFWWLDFPRADARIITEDSA